MCRKIVWLSVIVFVSSFFLGTSLTFAAWPERPITMIIPWAAGGGTDINARLVGKLLEKELGIQVPCINRTGGSGVVGHKAIADAAPDGYTIGCITAELNMMHWAGLTDLDYKGFTPLALLTAVAGAVFVEAGSPYKTGSDLVNAIKTNPGKIKASGAGIGSIWHLATAGMLDALNLKVSDVVWVPNQGATPSIQDLAAGGLDMVICAPSEARAMYDAGKIRGLAYFAKERNPVFPNIPTFKEVFGKDYLLDSWGGVAAPKGLPDEIKEKLAQAIKRAFYSDEFRDTMARMGRTTSYKGPQEFFEFMAAMDQEFGKTMKAVGIAK